jgi:hypothetical protein
MNSDEIELIQIREYNNSCEEMCCICLSNSDFHSSFSTEFVKMFCCNQTLHKECFLDWINYPINKNSYNNKFDCVICKTKIKNFNDIISLGEFVNYIENKQIDKRNDALVLHYKRIISELYKDSIVTNIFNSDTQHDEYNTDIKFCFYNLFCIFFFLVIITIIILVGNLLVKK